MLGVGDLSELSRKGNAILTEAQIHHATGVERTVGI